MRTFILLAAAFLPLTAMADTVVPPRVFRADFRKFARADRNVDEVLSATEFRALCLPYSIALRRYPLTGRGYAPADLAEFTDVLFQWFDADDSGSVDFGEWLDGRHRVEAGFSGPPIRGLAVFDVNRDAWVRAGEFHRLMLHYFPSAKSNALLRQIVAEFREITGWQGGQMYLPSAFSPGSSASGSSGSFSSSAGSTLVIGHQDSVTAVGWLTSLQERDYEISFDGSWPIGDDREAAEATDAGPRPPRGRGED